MAGRSVEEVLAPLVIRGIVSRTTMPGTSLSKHFGWNIGNGPVPGAMMAPGNDAEGNVGEQRGNTITLSSRTGQYDYFDMTRRIATGSVPDMPPTVIAPQKAGYVRFTVPRSHEKLPLSYESMNNMRGMGGPAGNVDTMGVRYIRAQQNYMAARQANMVEFQTAAMIRGRYYFVQQGDQLYQSFTGTGAVGEVLIDYQIPATHKTQLALGSGGANLISTTWANAAADIPADCYAIQAAQLQETGQRLSDVFVTSVVAGYVQKNTAVKALAGTHEPFEFVDRKGNEPGEYAFRLKGMPWLTWHVVDYGLELWDTATSAFTWQKLIPDTMAAFVPPVDGTWTTYGKYAEAVTEGPNGKVGLQAGFYMWGYPYHEPSGWNLCSIMNGFPLLLVPKGLMTPTVVF